ncbi:Chromatin assembly factor 1 subunit p50 [Datura stramonium]|uniref:acetyl-CoA carboxytransferase n=1 Tax=Datura stramonium TaxID=4076 RepID=A0ABS8RPV8_DATST|nr:Chromatin assembly factor 1 subunit p50 [Datura stramonium]
MNSRYHYYLMWSIVGLPLSTLDLSLSPSPAESGALILDSGEWLQLHILLWRSVEVWLLKLQLQTFFVAQEMVRKVKKHEYPWPEDPDLNVRGGVLSHLSPFKPLKEKPKPVTLDFETPYGSAEKIIDVQKMANETGLDFSDQIISLENKYQQALKDLYTHLTPIQRVNIARHPNRPTFLDHVFNITEKFVELHGDRAGYDDPAIVTGLGTINGRSYMFMGHQKGRNTKENIQRAYADLKSEELGQGEAIAHNLRTMFGLSTNYLY